MWTPIPPVVILASFFPLYASAVTLNQVVAAYRQSTVFIRVDKAHEVTGAVTSMQGTGFILNDKGFVLTAAHVVSGGPSLQVNVRGATGSREGPEEGMEVLYENSSFDVAVVRFKNTALARKPVKLGDPWLVTQDATIYALGYPGAEEWFHTEGKLSGIGPKGSWNTTITLNPGMSGGPIFNASGEVVAMVWGGVNTPGVSGINRVLPINLMSEPIRMAGAQVPSGLVEVPYRVDVTQDSMGGATATSQPYIRTFQAQPGLTIADYRYVAKSANNASAPKVELSNDRKTLTVQFSLKSGPAYDQWRGWMDGEVLTKQIPEQP